MVLSLPRLITVRGWELDPAKCTVWKERREGGRERKRKKEKKQKYLSLKSPTQDISRRNFFLVFTSHLEHDKSRRNWP